MFMAEPWFITRDVAKMLNIGVYQNGHVETAEVTRLVRKDEKTLLRRTTPHLTPVTVRQLFSKQQPSRSAISESGLYKLIMRSDKPEAVKFQDWVTRDVLPSIRKTGGSLLNEESRDTAKADDHRYRDPPERPAHDQQPRCR